MARQSKAIESVSNDGANVVDASAPYTMRARVQGTAALLFHRYSVEAVEAKGAAAKGSKAKKTDDVESYVWRTDAGNLAIPGEAFRQAIATAAKRERDPSSTGRKSAYDLVKAAILIEQELCDLGVAEWAYIDQRRAVVQRSAVTRRRPALDAGWTCTFDITVLTPEYVSRDLLHQMLVNAGRLVGVCDFRPTYGRFNVTLWEDHHA